MADDQALPDCDELFTRFFDRWYDDASRTRKEFKATRPDAEPCADAGTSASDASALIEKSAHKVLDQVNVMARAAIADWSEPIGASPELDHDWIDAFDKYWDRERIADLIREANPEEFSNDYFVTCCEFGAALGEVLIAHSPRCEWLADWPYWESAVYDRDSGYRINVFHWAIKKFSEYGVDDGLAAKLGCTVELIKNAWRQPE
jgi:hypothetical protein